MTAVDLLLDLSGRGVRLWADGEQLRFRAPSGVLTAADREILVEHKAELLPLLNLAQVGPATWHPATYGQEALFYLQRLNPESVQYNLFQAVEIGGRLEAATYEKALALVIERHSVLRTLFVATPSGPLQVVPDSAPPMLRQIDLSHLTTAERQTEVESIIGRHARRPFDLEKELPLAPLLLRLESQQHLFLMTIHHIAFDGWSTALFQEELLANYQLLLEGDESAPTKRPLQYYDFARWQRGGSAGDHTAGVIDYWRPKLAELSSLDLPYKGPRPLLPTGRAGRHTFEVRADLVQELRSLGNEEGATLFMVMLAAFKLLFYRYTGQTDLAIGVPIAGRGRREFEDVIGYFVNTLVMRSDYSGRPSFRTALRRVRETALSAFSHQDVPFVRLVEELKPKRDLHRNPLVQVIMTFNERRSELPEVTGLNLRSLEMPEQEATFDLDLSLHLSPSGLRGAINYSLDLFEVDAIERLAGHYGRLLESIAKSPDMPIGRLPMLRANERKGSVVEWNQTQAAFPHDSCIHELIEQQVEKGPEAVAVSFEDRELSYRQLNAMANQIARALTERGVCTGSLVGIFMARSEKMVVVLLAIHKTGAAYLPLDPTYPSSRLAFMVEEASPRAIVTDGASLPFEHHGVVLDLSHESTLKETPATNLEINIDSRSLAYVIYTSGSTGRPKGVQVTHRNLANLLTSIASRPGIHPADRMSSLSSLSFDMSPLDIFLPLICGAKVIIVSREVATNGTRLLDFVEDNSATIMQATPSTWRMLIDSGWKRGGPRQILCGGEAWTWDLAEAILERCPAVYNLYGATEMTIYSTLQRLQKGDGRIVVGRPLANTQLYVLDEYMEPAPVGVVGELFLGGDGVSEGYLKRPGLTAEQFVPDPYRDEPGARVYKTGDLGRTLPDGSIEFVGRRDGQVKIRGFRIELGEIEARLRRHSNVRDTVVITHELSTNDRRLVAYVVPEPGHEVSPIELTRFLKPHLPEYMVPALFVSLDSLPMSPSRKVDRLALPSPNWGQQRSSQKCIAPRNPTEEKVARTWAEILSIERVGVYDNFFDLGGHSLLAVRLMARIERQFNSSLPLTVLLEEATVEHMALALEPSHPEQRREPLVALTRGGEARPLYIVTAGYGDVLALGQMAGELEPTRPVYALQPPSDAGLAPPARDLDTLVSIYVKVIEGIQPEGTLQVAGYCSGGLIAFELARHLARIGRQVDHLLLMEAPFAYSTDFHGFYRRFGGQIGRLLPNPEKVKWRPLQILRALFADDGLAAHLETLAGYRAGEYSGRLTLIQARWSHIRWFIGWRRWRRAVKGDIERYIVAGDHDNFLRGRRAKGLAETVSGILKD